MANFPIVVDVMIKGLDTIKGLLTVTERMADRLDDLADRLDDVKKAGTQAGDAAEDAGEKIKDAGDDAKGAGNKFKGAGKDVKDAGVDLERAASQFRAMGSAGTLAGDTLERFSVITSGPLGLAIGGAVIGIGALSLAAKGLTAAISAGIEANAEYAKGFDKLNLEFQKTKAIFGQILLAAVGLGKGFDQANTKLSNFNKNIARDAPKIADNIRTLINFTLELIKFIGTGLLGLRALFVGTGELLAELVINYIAPYMEQIGDIIGEMLFAVRDLVFNLRDAAIALGMTDQALTLQQFALHFSEAAASAKEFGAEVKAAAGTAVVGSGFMGELAEIDRFRKGITELQTGLDKLKGTKVNIDLSGIGAGAGGAGAPGAGLIDPSVTQQDAAIRAGGFASLAGLALETGAGLAQKRKEDLARVRAEEDAEQQRRLDKALADAKALEAQAQQMGGTFFKVVATFQETMVGSVEIVKNGLAAATGEVANFFGAFAAGESTLSEFGDAMADLAANIANTFGDLFIKQGIGLALFNPGVGALLIAAGFALKMLGGAVASKGSANRGTGASTGSGASGAAASQAVAREVTRSLRPSGPGGENVTNIEVVIGGRSITPEMVAIVDDIARQRRSRYLGRRMGAF